MGRGEPLKRGCASCWPKGAEPKTEDRIRVLGGVYPPRLRPSLFAPPEALRRPAPPPCSQVERRRKAFGCVRADKAAPFFEGTRSLAALSGPSLPRLRVADGGRLLDAGPDKGGLSGARPPHSALEERLRKASSICQLRGQIVLVATWEAAPSPPPATRLRAEVERRNVALRRRGRAGMISTPAVIDPYTNSRQRFFAAQAQGFAARPHVPCPALEDRRQAA